MPHRATLDQFVQTCQDAARVSDLWECVLDFLHARGIPMVSYHSDDAQRFSSRRLGIVSDGFPQKWVDHYMDNRLALVDPIPDLAAKMAQPFFWSDAHKLMRLTAEQREYLRQLAASGLGDGLAIEVFGPKLRNAYFGLGFGGPAPEITALEIATLQSAVQIAHLRYCAMTSMRQIDHEPLSPRELEILQWIAKGKSNTVIAEILGISKHSVDTMIRRIYEKLKVNDRISAAIRGLGAGLVRTRRGLVA